jgi:general secretion pathway protein H
MCTQATRLQPLVTDSGLTLLEMLVVLVIVSLGLAIALTATRNPSRGLELRATAQNLMTQLRTTRAQAIARNVAAGVSFDVSQKRYKSDADVRWYQLANDMALTASVAGGLNRANDGRRIVFFADGSSTGGSIRIARGNQWIDVSVEWLTGAVRLGAL